MVIAADGANSKIRPHLSDVPPLYSGVTLIQGDIDEAEKSASKLFSFSKIMAFDDVKMLGFSTKGDGSIMFIAEFKCLENWLAQSNINFNNKAEVFTWFKTEFSNWSND